MEVDLSCPKTQENSLVMRVMLADMTAVLPPLQSESSLQCSVTFY